MSKIISNKFITGAVALVFAGAFATSASAVITRTPSPAQSECMKSNPNDHKAYLTCVKGKKDAKKAGMNHNSATQPAAATNGNGTTAPVYNTNPSSPAAAKYQ